MTNYIDRIDTATENAGLVSTFFKNGLFRQVAGFMQLQIIQHQFYWKQAFEAAAEDGRTINEDSVSKAEQKLSDLTDTLQWALAQITDARAVPDATQAVIKHMARGTAELPEAEEKQLVDMMVKFEGLTEKQAKAQLKAERRADAEDFERFGDFVTADLIARCVPMVGEDTFNRFHPNTRITSYVLSSMINACTFQLQQNNRQARRSSKKFRIELYGQNELICDLSETLNTVLEDVNREIENQTNADVDSFPDGGSETCEPDEQQRAYVA